jgi:hypothetical protein
MQHQVPFALAAPLARCLEAVHLLALHVLLDLTQDLFPGLAFHAPWDTSPHLLAPLHVLLVCPAHIQFCPLVYLNAHRALMAFIQDSSRVRALRVPVDTTQQLAPLHVLLVCLAPFLRVVHLNAHRVLLDPTQVPSPVFASSVQLDIMHQLALRALPA